MRNKPAAIRRISSFGPQPIKFPSHYVFLLITEVVASSPLLYPAGNVSCLILNDRARNSGFGAKISASHFRDQFFLGVNGVTKLGRLGDALARESHFMASRVGQ
jgi:hypothetical protein